MNIIGKRTAFFILAGLLAIVCIISLATAGLKTGVEFSSGSIITVDFDNPVDQSALRQQLDTLGYEDALIQSTGAGDYIIRTPELTEDTKTQLISGLEGGLGTLQVKEFDNVSSMIASETARNAAIAVSIAAVAMLLYIAWAFRKMPNPFQFGTCAIIGLVFDVLMALGIFSIMGAMYNWEINLMFITGILAVIGYSINNTVIVFDRIRENVNRGISNDFEVTTNASVVQTLARSFNTSLTTLFTLAALAIFVGASIQNFVVVLIIGIIAGVFSSTCISPSILVAWNKRSSAAKARLVAAKAKS